jgi:hypothetical protein
MFKDRNSTLISPYEIDECSNNDYADFTGAFGRRGLLLIQICRKLSRFAHNLGQKWLLLPPPPLSYVSLAADCGEV